MLKRRLRLQVGWGTNGFCPVAKQIGQMYLAKPNCLRARGKLGHLSLVSLFKGKSTTSKNRGNTGLRTCCQIYRSKQFRPQDTKPRALFRNFGTGARSNSERATNLLAPDPAPACICRVGKEEIQRTTFTQLSTRYKKHKKHRIIIVFAQRPEQHVLVSCTCGPWLL